MENKVKNSPKTKENAALTIVKTAQTEPAIDVTHIEIPEKKAFKLEDKLEEIAKAQHLSNKLAKLKTTQAKLNAYEEAEDENSDRDSLKIYCSGSGRYFSFETSFVPVISECVDFIKRRVGEMISETEEQIKKVSII